VTGTGSGRRLWYELVPGLAHVRSDFLEAFHEREDLLRHELVGDVDISALKADRAARAAHTPRSTGAGGRSSVDPDDDGDLPYSFY